MQRRSKTSIGDRLVNGSAYAITTLFALFCLIPFWMVIIGSFTDESSLRAEGFKLIPGKLSLYAYEFLLRGGQVYRSYLVTIETTVLGTLAAVLISAMFAYVLAHRKVKYKNALSFLTYFTMLFGSGLVGFYILVVNWLHLKDTLWALILPYLLNPFNTFVLVSFFRTVPYELNEAATVDGSGEWRTFFRIILPITTPVLATTTLLYALQYWNDWWLALLFIDDYTLHPLQIMIRQLISNMNAAAYIQGASTGQLQQIPAYGVQLATVCVTIGPIVLLYPFLQRYFVKGLTIGSVKG
ncbi:carbohydrate ABC transporter permease [Cohnella rhizosphaerae]|uniref:Carbohydrate ABC transporter permease n=1 Tax=Cohnella rhizosphaerae TaxID=1457232 RepID=A0A9X4KQZ4_9BACL|nr:carbohydrate ABC transporter permease [Cohnella rhizosphaerae]MDG0808606.1 carbohydrate ABC transporter permease [Cohnella rhizosphaerae]